jgi:hypothetical protein
MIKKYLKFVPAVATLFLLLATKAKAMEGLNITEGSSVTTISGLIEWFINDFLGPAFGTATFFSLLVGGFTYLTAGANVDRATRAKRAIGYAILGLILAMLSFAIVAIVVKALNDIFA